ncbi:MAG: lycopene cyclase domain-containing protein [Mycobacterium leprae]
MTRLTYLAVLAGCLLVTLPLELLLHVGVYRRWPQLLRAVLPVAAVFVGWDVVATRAGWWRFDERQTLGLTLPGGLPLEELLFFLVVPTCAVLGYEAVRRVRG